MIARGEAMKKSIQNLWSEEDGMFYCKDLKTGELVKRMDPTNFYHWGALRGYISLLEK